MSIFRRSRSTIIKSIEKRSGPSGEFTFIEDQSSRIYPIFKMGSMRIHAFGKPSDNIGTQKKDATEPSFNTEGTVEILRPYDKVQIIIFGVLNVTFAANILIVIWPNWALQNTSVSSKTLCSFLSYFDLSPVCVRPNELQYCGIVVVLIDIDLRNRMLVGARFITTE